MGFLLAAALFAANFGALQAANPPDSAVFPPVATESLAGKKYALPQDFEGERNLVIIAFEREQQANVDTWLHQIKQFGQLDSGLRVYELPTISRLDPFRRWFINTGMRRGIPDKSARARTLTLYLDKQAFKKSLQLESEKTIYALLVNRAGQILWRAEGDYDDNKAASLKLRLEELANVHP